MRAAIIIFSIMAALFALCLYAGLAEQKGFGNAEAFKLALEEDGFIVQQGGLGYQDMIKEYNAGLLPSVYGNNPTTYYLAYFVPPPLGEKLSALESSRAKLMGMSGNASNIFKIRPDEAIIFVGRTPPECKYFSYDDSLMFKTFGGEIRWVWMDFGDALNNLVIKTEGTPNGSPGNPFNQTTMVISTADKGIDRRIRAAAESAGYSEDLINTNVLSSSILNLGLANDSDTFSFYLRPALFRDKQAGSAYLGNPPAVILRITPKDSAKLAPFEMPELRVRGTGKTEIDLLDDLNLLRQAILAKFGGLEAKELPTSIWIPEGFDSIQTGINAWGPTRDACYLWTANQTVNSPTPPFCNLSNFYGFLRDPGVTLGNDPSEFLIVYGVNHVATGKATYSSFAVYGADIWNGIGAVTDQNFSGTAEEYLPGDPNAKYLYAYKVARNCSGDKYCFEVPWGAKAYGLELKQPLFIAWRIYLENSTKVGPAYAELVYDRAIKFGPRK